MTSYTGIREALEGRVAEIESAQQALAQERAAVEEALQTARTLEKDFGKSSEIPSEQPKAGGAHAAGSKSAGRPTHTPGKPARRGSSPRRASAPSKPRAGTARAKARVIVNDLLQDGRWAHSNKLRAAVEADGISQATYKLAVRELVEAGHLQKRGWAQATEYRLAGAHEPEESTADEKPINAAVPRPSKSTPEPPAAPARPQEDKSPEGMKERFRARVLEAVERHPNETDALIAQRMGRGTKSGQVEVSAALKELLEAGKVACVDDNGKRRWRLKGAPKPKLGAPVQTSPEATGHQSPQTGLEKAVYDAVEFTPKTIDELAAATGAGKTSCVEVANALVGRGHLRRGIQGMHTVYGRKG